MFGPHSTGKTYFLKGMNSGKERGMMPRSVEEILKLMALYSVMNEDASHKMGFKLSFAAGLSFKGEMNDLLQGNGKHLGER